MKFSGDERPGHRRPDSRGARLRSPPAGRLTRSSQGLVARFANKTGDSTLGDFGAIAADVVAEQLARTGIVSVVDPVTALASSNDVRKSAARLHTPDAVPVLASRTHAGVVVTGSYYRVHDTLVAEALVTDARRNVVLAATEPVRGAFADRSAMLDALRARVVGALALRLDERLTRIVPPGSTPTYQAYQALIAGIEVFMNGQWMGCWGRAVLRAGVRVGHDVRRAPDMGGVDRRQPSTNVRAVDILEKRRATLSEIDRYALDYQRATLSGSTEEMLAAAQNAARLAPGSHWTHNRPFACSGLAGSMRQSKPIQRWIGNTAGSDRFGRSGTTISCRCTLRAGTARS